MTPPVGDIRGRPRWSVGPLAYWLLPVLMAGLLESSAHVLVGPPLLASGPSSGLIAGLPLPPTRLPLTPAAILMDPSPMPRRLLMAVLKAPQKSGAVAAVFSAMSVLKASTVASRL